MGGGDSVDLTFCHYFLKMFNTVTYIFYVFSKFWTIYFLLRKSKLQFCVYPKRIPPPHANSGVDAPSASSAGAKRFQREEEDEEEEGGVYKPWLVQTTIIVPK